MTNGVTVAGIRFLAERMAVQQLTLVRVIAVQKSKMGLQDLVLKHEVN